MTERTSITIKDVAQKAGVGQATAARALGGYGRINPATRKRVLVAAEQLGYQANALARSMVTRSTQTLGLVVTDIENAFFAHIARAVADIAHQHHYSVILMNTDENLRLEREAVHVLAAKQVDGLIVVPATHSDDAHLVQLLRRHVPVVLLDRSMDRMRADTIMIDNERAAQRAIHYLIELGHQRIGIVTTESTIDTIISRTAGYRRALAEAGLSVRDEWIRACEYKEATVRREIETLLDLPPDIRPTAILATDSFITMWVFRMLRERGLRLPEQMSLIGFDDADWMTMVRPNITVIDQPVYELGRAAAEQLIKRIEREEEPPRRIFLETTLIERESCGPWRPSASVTAS